METQLNSTSLVTTRSVGIRFGLIGAVLSIAYFVILNIAGLDITRGFWNWVQYCITIVLVVFAHKYYKDNTNGFMSYGQGMGIVFWMGLISALISSIFTYLYITFIDTSFLPAVKERQIEALQQQGMSNAQIDQAMKFSEMFMTAEAMLVMMFVGSIIATIIIGLIVSIFTQRKNPEPVF